MEPHLAPVAHEHELLMVRLLAHAVHLFLFLFPTLVPTTFLAHNPVVASIVTVASTFASASAASAAASVVAVASTRLTTLAATAGFIAARRC